VYIESALDLSALKKIVNLSAPYELGMKKKVFLAEFEMGLMNTVRRTIAVRVPRQLISMTAAKKILKKCGKYGT